MDMDGDGHVDIVELLRTIHTSDFLKKILGAKGWKHGAFEGVAAGNTDGVGLFTEIDKDGSGRISWGEFSEYLVSYAGSLTSIHPLTLNCAPSG